MLIKISKSVISSRVTPSLYGCTVSCPHCGPSGDLRKGSNVSSDVPWDTDQHGGKGSGVACSPLPRGSNTAEGNSHNNIFICNGWSPLNCVALYIGLMFNIFAQYHDHVKLYLYEPLSSPQRISTY